MPRHVISEVSHDDSPPTSLLNRATIDLQEVEVPIDVHFAVLILHYASGRQDLAVVLREVEKCLKLVDVRALHEIGWV